MWINPLFSADSRQEVAQLISAHALATLVVEAPMRAAHLPLLLEDDGERMTLIGHIPRVDPLSEAIAAGEEVLCIFHGARAYVSPDWYTAPGLSTYNFSVAHLQGRSEPMTETSELRAHLVDLTRAHEALKSPSDGGPWEIDDVADARIDGLLPLVMGFRIHVESAQAKTKFGQNRSQADRIATQEHLRRSADEEARMVAERMTETLQEPDARRPGH